MPKLSRDSVVAEALDLLDEVGLDAVSTRALARRLDVEQPSLYWHFRKKEQLLAAMAEAAMAPHRRAALPQPGDDWREWFLENTRSFRQALLARRDGARLHAGHLPAGSDLDRITHKMEFLAAVGIPTGEAQTAMLTASRFTVGAVLEEQADRHGDPEAAPAGVPVIDQTAAFEAGLRMILEGLTHRLSVPAQDLETTAPKLAPQNLHPSAPESR